MPDLSNMPNEDFEKWLASVDLDENQREALTKSTNRTDLFNKILDYRGLQRANERYDDFQQYLQKTRIFLSPEVREKFDQIKLLLRKVWAARKVDIQRTEQTGGVDFFTKALDTFTDEVEPLMGELECIIQRKLFPESESPDK